MTKWMKWRHKFASHAERTWRWTEVDPTCLREILSDLADEYDWSELYRGIDYELFDTPDPEWLAQHLGLKKRELLHLGQEIERLETLLKDLGQESA